MLRRMLLLLLIFSATARAVELRVATFNVGAKFVTGGYPEFGIGSPGTVDHETVKAVLARIGADVVALQEIHSADLSGSPSDLIRLASALGYPHVYNASLSGTFDTSLRVSFLSRHPFLSTSGIGSPPGAKEITRRFPMVRVDVPGTTRDPVMISGHLKAGTTQADRFRRAIEMRRLVGAVNAAAPTGSDNYIILGDFNPSGANTIFNSLPAGLPGTYVLGADVSFPVAYSRDMTSYFTGWMPALLDPRQLDGSPGTHWSGNVLDLLMVSPGLAGRPFATEIYNSALDTTNASGLPKVGAPLADGTSLVASDHYAVFADLELDQDFSDLALAASVPAVVEGSAEGALLLTVTLPGPAAGAVEVMIFSEDAGAAEVVDGLVVIPPGETSASTAARTRRDFLATGNRTVMFTALASGFDGDTTTVELIDSDGPYRFTLPGEAVTEDFDGFGGGHDPAPWTSGGVVWVGQDGGTLGIPGARAYGEGDERAIGFLAGDQGMTLTAPFLNQSGVPLTALEIAYDAEQWRVAQDGSADAIHAELVTGGAVIPLPELSHHARTDPPGGALTGGMPVRRTTRIAGIRVEAGQGFELRFRFEPGAGSGAVPDEVFVNELHYDNDGLDAGEFIEVVVGPGFEGSIGEVELLLYNGANGQAYGTAHPLDGFQTGAVTASGHRIFWKEIDGIQNGAPDGLALVVAGEVRQFLSYEGSFTALNGPAGGMTSTDMGVTQKPPPAIGFGALSSTGSGGASADFAWGMSPGTPHSPGQPNAGQSFTLPGLPAQGLAVDSLAVTFLPDNDLDGIPDDEDPDDDNDGMSDEDELAFGTDPLDPNSVFRPSLVIEEGALVLTFPGAEGFIYIVEGCDDLTSWEELSTHVGSGGMLRVPLPQNPGRFFVRVKAGGS